MLSEVINFPIVIDLAVFSILWELTASLQSLRGTGVLTGRFRELLEQWGGPEALQSLGQEFHTSFFKNASPQ